MRYVPGSTRARRCSQVYDGARSRRSAESRLHRAAQRHQQRGDSGATHFFTAGLPIGSTGGHADTTNTYRKDLAGDLGVTDGVINNVDDAVKAVRLHYKEGRARRCRFYRAWHVMDDEDIRLMKEHATWYIPTLSAGAFFADKASVPGYYPTQIAAKAATVGSRFMAATTRAYKAGVKIAFGTDAAPRSGCD